MSHRLRRISIRTLYGACASLITSATNIAILTALRGEQYGWVCLSSCVTDVALNALALAWVTSSTSSSCSHSSITLDRFSLPTMDVGALAFARSDYEQGNEPSCLGTSTMQMTLPSPLPASFYDYLPRDQVPQADTQKTTGKERLESWRTTLRGLRRSDSGMPQATGAANHVADSSCLHEEVTQPTSKPDLPLQPTANS